MRLVPVKAVTFLTDAELLYAANRLTCNHGAAAAIL
jgi:hypothetical protein